jgi:hypothetical protein
MTGPADPEPLPRWLKLLYTVLVCSLAPLFAWEYGFSNFLWFSNIILIGTLIGVWTRSRLLLGMMALAGILPEIGWNVAFWGRLLFELEFFGLVDYMFSQRIPLWARVLSLYHVPLPFVLLWIIWRVGYDRRALAWQTLLAWVVLPVSFVVADPFENINMVYGLVDQWGRPHVDPPLPVFGLMVGLPLLIYWPTHALLIRLAARRHWDTTDQLGQ